MRRRLGEGDDQLRVNRTDRSLTSVARALSKEASLVVDRVMPKREGIVILLYHRVGVGSGSVIDLSVEAFGRQLAQLSEKHRVIGLDQAADELAGPGPVAPGVVLTFDDGTADFIDNALPVLADYRIPATLYVATGLLDTSRAWPDGGIPMTRCGLAEVAESGFVTLGSHTHGHKLLDRLPSNEIDDELDRSIAFIEDCCGVPVDHFAYPKAVAPSSSAASAVAKRFRTAALAEPGANASGQDVQRLRRTPIQSSDAPRHLEAKFRGGMALESTVRTVVNRARYRGRVD